MTGMVSDMEKLQIQLEQAKEVERNEEKLPFSVLAGAGCYLDFILPCLAEEQVEMMTLEDIQGEKLQGEIEGLKERHRLFAAPVEEGLLKQLDGQLDRRYPHEELSRLFVKTTVSELKIQALHGLTGELKEMAGEDGADRWGQSQEKGFTRQLFEEPEIVPYIPAFISSREGLSGTDRGSAYHKVMELLDFKRLVEQKDMQGELKRQMEGFVREGKMEQQWREAVSLSKLLTFMVSPLAHRMAQADLAGELYREQPFVLGISAKNLGEQFPEQEQVLIQGMIDVYFKEEGRIILVDYKTDRVSTEKELTKRYGVQLDYYARALERLTGMEVAEKILYSFALGKEVCSNELAN